MDNDIVENKTNEMSTNIAQQIEQEIRSRMKNGLMKCSQCCTMFPLSEMHISSRMEKTVTHHKDERTTIELKQRNRYLCRHCRPKQTGGC